MAIRYDQIASGDREGNGTKFQMYGGGSPNAGEFVLYDANGNVVSSGAKGSTKGDILIYNGSTWTNLAVGTDTKVLTANSGATNGADWESVAGGGSPAGIPWNFVSRNVSAPPAAGSFTWVNQGGASVSTPVAGILGMKIPSAAGTNWRILTVPLAYSTPYTVTMALLYDAISVNTIQSGLCLMNSSSTAFVGPNFVNGGAYNNQRWSSPTAFNSQVLNATVGAVPGPGLIWMRISDNGTTRKYWWSNTGVNFIEMTNEAHNNFVTADVVGWGAYNTTGFDMWLYLYSWSQVNSA